MNKPSTDVVLRALQASLQPLREDIRDLRTEMQDGFRDLRQAHEETDSDVHRLETEVELLKVAKPEARRGLGLSAQVVVISTLALGLLVALLTALGVPPETISKVLPPW